MTNTKCIVIQTEVKPEPAVKKTPIKFEYFLDFNRGIRNASASLPTDFKYVELISPGYSVEIGDVMSAYDNPDNRGNGCVFLGKWNDGVAE